MRAHLNRTKKRAEIDLIREQRGIVARFVFGIGSFLQSDYFNNVRKSFGLLLSGWLWYVINTKLYTPPEYDD